MAFPIPTHGTLAGYPHDILELADALDFESFAVMGASGGGPYALACAYRLPDRLTAAAVVSGIGPLSLPNSTRHMLLQTASCLRSVVFRLR